MNTIKTTIHRFTEISRPEIEMIIAHTLKKPREFVLIFPEYKLKSHQLSKIEKLAKRRHEGESLAYLVGYKEFYGFEFLVNSHVLVPRPETELIIDEVLAMTDKNKPSTIIDIGTGSGCIAITLAKLLNPELPIKFFAIDISRTALGVAKKNAKKLLTNKNIKFIYGNLLTPFSKLKIEPLNSKIIITANLPYLTPSQIANSPSIQKEPRLALESGHDGLRHYRQLFQQVCKQNLANYTLFCEIDETQGVAMSQLIKRELPLASFEIKKDLGGYDRLAIISAN